MRVALLAVGPYVFYLSMRSSLDAVAVRSYNARSNIAGLATFIAVTAVLLATGIAEPAFSVAWGFAAGVAVQGGLTFAFVRRLFGVRVADYAPVRVLPLVALTAGGAVAALPLVERSGSPLVLLAGVELVLSAVYLGGLARLARGVDHLPTDARAESGLKLSGWTTSASCTRAWRPCSAWRPWPAGGGAWPACG